MAVFRRLGWLLVAALPLPFLGKPVHIDDANFLALARGARLDPWRPHAVPINWQGTTERAFDVLSNPPGIGWWLAPVAHAPVWLAHLWMLPWLALAILGAHRLGRRFLGRGLRADAAVVLLLASPVALVTHSAFTPDLPLLACTLAGLGGVVAKGSLRQRTAWALVAGCGVLFRYSGLAVVPLVALWPVLHGRWRRAVWLGGMACVPAVLLGLHDWHAYGELHVVAMTRFQSVSTGASEVGRKLVASLAMLSSVLVLPVLLRGWGAVVGAAVGAGLGAWGAVVSGQLGEPEVWLWTVLWTAGGGAVVGTATALERREDRFLTVWLWGGLVFLLQLRFTAARYWLPFAVPAVLGGLSRARSWQASLAVALTPVVALLVAVDDAGLAHAQRSLAQSVVAVAPTGVFSGHWGWQHHLEAAGWTALEEDAAVPAGTVLARSAMSWPQDPAPGCFETLWEQAADRTWPGLRSHTVHGAANLHAHVISGQPPVETYAGMGLGWDPFDVVWVGRAVPCEGASPDIPPLR